jgi:pilus assembly protein TadC
MKSSTRTILKRIATVAAAATGSLLIAFGLFALWFAMAWADAWGGDADLAPGLGFLGAGATVIVAMIWMRKRNRDRPAA